MLGARKCEKRFRKVALIAFSDACVGVLQLNGLRNTMRNMLEIHSELSLSQAMQQRIVEYSVEVKSVVSACRPDPIYPVSPHNFFSHHPRPDVPTGTRAYCGTVSRRRTGCC